MKFIINAEVANCEAAATATDYLTKYGYGINNSWSLPLA